jgi:type IV secretion system protein VirD4
MSEIKGKARRWALGVVLLLASVGWLWWTVQLKNPHSVPYRLTHDVWPMLRWWLLAVLVVAALWALRAWMVRRSPAGLIARWNRKAKRNNGLASWWDVFRRAGKWALRRKAHVLRPTTYGDLPRWRRLRVPTRELGFRLCRVGMQWVYASVEMVTLRITGPRGGKTGELGNHVVDAPGAVLATSTKHDLVELTIASRQTRGPVHIFNPEGLGGDELRSTFRWNPIIGCEQPAVATQRAGYLLSGSPSMANIGAREFWTGQAVRVLANLLHAAALGRHSMLDVLAWASDPDGSAGYVLQQLQGSPASHSWTVNYQQFVSTNVNTRSSTTTSIMPALEWLNDPRIAELALGSPDEQFDVAEWLARTGTLYLLGSERPHGSVAPLFTCLTAHIFETAKLLASKARRNRLDPPATFVLDEAPLICPVPLDRWTADAGGRGIAIHIAAQSRSQLYAKWGEHGGRTIWNNCGAIMIYGGVNDENDLDAVSRLTDERDEMVETVGPDGSVSRTTRKVPVLSPARIRELPDWRALLIRRGLRVTIGVVVPVWDRKDVKRADKRAQAHRADLARLAAAVDASVADVEPAADQATAASVAAGAAREGAGKR